MNIEERIEEMAGELFDEGKEPKYVVMSKEYYEQLVALANSPGAEEAFRRLAAIAEKHGSKTYTKPRCVAPTTICTSVGDLKIFKVDEPDTLVVAC